MDDRHNLHGAQRPLDALNAAARACSSQARRPSTVRPAGSTPRSSRGFTARLLTTLLALFLLPQAQAQFLSVCGRAPSGINDCPWYQVEIVIFRNDNARAASAEDLASQTKPRWSPRLATLLPPAGEALMPMRTAEYLALWQSAGQAPEWLQVTPGLSVEQERFLLAIQSIGKARHPVDRDFLAESSPLDWDEQGPPDEIGGDHALGDASGFEPEESSIPAIDPVIVIAQPPPELTPQIEIVQAPDLRGAISIDLAFREVPAGQRLLDGEAARLRRARGFEVLGQLAWRQPFAANEPGLAQLIYSADLAESSLPEGELLLGTLTVDLRRFLHAHLDLYFKAPGPSLGNGSDDAPVFQERGQQRAEWIHIEQSRRMRSGELHYLDHPWIGAIIRIERYAAPSEP